jgi:hypothetical protein
MISIRTTGQRCSGEAERRSNPGFIRFRCLLRPTSLDQKRQERITALRKTRGPIDGAQLFWRVTIIRRS